MLEKSRWNYLKHFATPEQLKISEPDRAWRWHQIWWLLPYLITAILNVLKKEPDLPLARLVGKEL